MLNDAARNTKSKLLLLSLLLTTLTLSNLFIMPLPRLPSAAPTSLQLQGAAEGRKPLGFQENHLVG